jgi:hypothetical protein
MDRRAENSAVRNRKKAMRAESGINGRSRSLRRWIIAIPWRSSRQDLIRLRIHAPSELGDEHPCSFTDLED